MNTPFSQWHGWDGFDVYVYTSNPVDWFPFSSMEKLSDIRKRKEEDYEYEHEEQQMVIDIVIKCCGDYSDEVDIKGNAFVSILPYGHVIVVFNNVHKGSPVVASTFDLRDIVRKADEYDEMAVYEITPSQFKFKRKYQ